MAAPRHVAAAREVAVTQQFPNLDAMIADAEFHSTHVCVECGEVQCDDLTCRSCGGELVDGRAGRCSDLTVRIYAGDDVFGRPP